MGTRSEIEKKFLRVLENSGESRISLVKFGVPELLLPPKIIRMFGPKTAIFASKYAFLGT